MLWEACLQLAHGITGCDTPAQMGLPLPPVLESDAHVVRVPQIHSQFEGAMAQIRNRAVMGEQLRLTGRLLLLSGSTATAVVRAAAALLSTRLLA